MDEHPFIVRRLAPPRVWAWDILEAIAIGMFIIALGLWLPALGGMHEPTPKYTARALP